MSKAIQLHIPEPCHENWENMTAQEKGRFCGSCQKMVIDFSVMDDKEIFNYISNASTQVCGRFAKHQLKREISVAENKRRFSWAYFWNVLLATFLVTESYAQGEPAMKKNPVTTNKPVLPGKLPTMGSVAVVEPVELTLRRDVGGVVMDRNTQLPLAGASVFVKGTTKGTMTDSLGRFHLTINNDDSVALMITYVGFTNKTLMLDDKISWQDLNVQLDRMETLGEVVLVGGITVSHKVKRKEKIKRALNSCMPAAIKKDIKIYPNPVVRGNDIQASVSLKQMGSYKLELLDVQGRVVEVQKLELNNNEQQVTIPTQSGWSTGIYWIRITAPGIKNVYQAKLLLQ